ncbi:MAG: hypothetical protein HC905_03545 [Bacteroidales bacterium]|nr:hypothetical protein [Bacteroidales bacterium]
MDFKSHFESFSCKLLPDSIVGFDDNETQLWSEKTSITTDPEKASRVWEALKKRLTSRAYDAVYRIHLSGAPGADMILYRFLVKVFTSRANIEENYADADVLKIKIWISKYARKPRGCDNL